MNKKIITTTVLVFLGTFVLAFAAIYFVFASLHNSDIELKDLDSTNVSSIVIGHQVIDDPRNINLIISALRPNEPLKEPCSYVRGTVFTINLRNGGKIRYQIMRYLKVSGSAILSGFDQSGFNYRQRLVAQLANVLEQAGAYLPKSGQFELSENGRIIEPALLKLPPRKTTPHTLFNIERASILNSPDELIYPNHFLAFIFFGLVVLIIYIAIIRKDKSWQQNLIVTLVICAAFGGASFCFECNALNLIKSCTRYQQLRTLLQKNECKITEGLLSDARYVRKGHNPAYLRELDVNGHKFWVSDNYDDERWCDSGSWVYWAPEQLQIGKPVRVWHASIPGWDNGTEKVEKAARIDIL